MRKIKILCDGNCFFRAVSHQLFNHENNHSELRSVAIKYISKNEFLFQSFISDEDKILHDYILHMSKLNTYADIGAQIPLQLVSLCSYEIFSIRIFHNTLLCKGM